MGEGLRRDSVAPVYLPGFTVARSDVANKQPKQERGDGFQRKLMAFDGAIFQPISFGFEPACAKFVKVDLRGVSTGQPFDFSHEIIFLAPCERLVSGFKRPAKLLAVALFRKDIIDARCFVASQVFASILPVAFR